MLVLPQVNYRSFFFSVKCFGGNFRLLGKKNQRGGVNVCPDMCTHVYLFSLSGGNAQVIDDSGRGGYL